MILYRRHYLDREFKDLAHGPAVLLEAREKNAAHARSYMSKLTHVI